MLATAFLLSGNNVTTKFQLHLPFFCPCHIVKCWLWVPVCFKNYHCCWHCGRGYYPADADPKFQDPHIFDWDITQETVDWYTRSDILVVIAATSEWRVRYANYTSPNQKLKLNNKSKANPVQQSQCNPQLNSSTTVQILRLVYTAWQKCYTFALCINWKKFPPYGWVHTVIQLLNPSDCPWRWIGGKVKVHAPKAQELKCWSGVHDCATQKVQEGYERQPDKQTDRLSTHHHGMMQNHNRQRQQHSETWCSSVQPALSTTPTTA